MPSSPQIARDEIFGMVTDELAVPFDFAFRYQGKLQPDPPKGLWVRLSMVEVTSVQSAFVMTEEPNPSPSEFETSGLITVQVFAPLALEDSFAKGDLLATNARDIFRRAETPSGVRFRNARKNEITPSDKFNRWNVIVEYEFDEIKGEGN